MLKTISLRVIAATLVFWTVQLAAQTAAVPTPSDFLGFEPGTDRKLADYNQVYAYFEKLAATSDRVKFSSIGKTTEGHEMGLAVISSPKNLANIEEIRKTNLALVDPRKLKPGEADALIARGKTIVCLNASIHSIEVGPTQATLPLAHFLATTRDPEWLKVLDDVVLVMLPCHNPDGYLEQVDWYRKYVGTPYEGCPLPGLYHLYAGHDNNRDWFMFNLQETRLTVTQVYKPWCPQIVMDMHQMSEDGPRMFIPPYQDPVEPNVDPLLIEQLNELGESVQKGLIAKGMKGIVNRTLFDAWSPSRAYMHYHGGVRFLCEIASCRQATPVEKRGIGRAATSRPDLNPAPWVGDRWSLADIVRYHNEAAMAVLRHASANRERWLKNFHEVFRKTCASTEGPAAYVIPLQTVDSQNAVLRILDFGGVEYSRARRELEVEGQKLAAGAFVVQRGQPFFGFVRALFENVPYPEVRETPDGPLRRPYDMTAHCLRLLMNLSIMSASTSPPPDALEQAADVVLQRSGGTEAGRFDRTVGVYAPFVPNVMDEGWTRLFLGLKSINYFSMTDRDVEALSEGRPTTSNLRDLRVLILPSLSADQILNGNRSEEFPPEFRGGIGERGAAWIDRFVREGGTLIALKDSTALPIQLFRLPIRNALSNLPEGRRLVIPGAILRLDLDINARIGLYAKTSIPALFDGGKAFEPDRGADRARSLRPTVLGRWASADHLHLAGHAEGLDLLGGKAAAVQCYVDRGQVILFGFSPQFRCQTWGTFHLLENAIRSGIKKFTSLAPLAVDDRGQSRTAG